MSSATYFKEICAWSRAIWMKWKWSKEKGEEKEKKKNKLIRVRRRREKERERERKLVRIQVQMHSSECKLCKTKNWMGDYFVNLFTVGWLGSPWVSPKTSKSTETNRGASMARLSSWILAGSRRGGWGTTEMPGGDEILEPGLSSAASLFLKETESWGGDRALLSRVWGTPRGGRVGDLAADVEVGPLDLGTER